MSEKTDLWNQMMKKIDPVRALKFIIIIITKSANEFNTYNFTIVLFKKNALINMQRNIKTKVEVLNYCATKKANFKIQKEFNICTYSADEHQFKIK